MAHSTHSLSSILDLRLNVRLAFGYEAGTSPTLYDPGQGASVDYFRARIVLADGTEQEAPAWLAALIAADLQDDMIFEAQSDVEERRCFRSAELRAA